MPKLTLERESMRLDKFLADSNLGTRSEVKAMIRKGQITVNGLICCKSDMQVQPTRDSMAVSGRVLAYEPFVYYMLYKPAGVICATVDKKEKTVLDLLAEEDGRRNLFPVGRLDKDTEGLLLLTDDGALSHELLSPRKHIAKTYYAQLDAPVSAEEITAFSKGFSIGEKKPTLPALLEPLGNNPAEVRVTITEGRYHQVKRMFEAFGQRVLYLKRVSMGNLLLDESLEPGEYRRLRLKEVEGIRGNVKRISE